MTPVWHTDGATQHCGDCLEVLSSLEAESFDAVLCDPPYGLEFMGKDWDHGVPSLRCWSAVLRVLKPGAMLLAFGGTRTHHRLMCAIEDAGFEIRDCLMWIYGSGFPKSHDISKAIDKAAGAKREVVGLSTASANRSRTTFQAEEKTHGYSKHPEGERVVSAPSTDAAKQWNGWGTALKPGYEPVILAMKPLDGTFAQNALEHGVAGLNVDGCRVNSEPRSTGTKKPHAESGVHGRYGRDKRTDRQQQYDANKPQRRWPANVILDEDAGEQLDEQSGIGASSGGPSRFFYCAKASPQERGEGNTHPTVKPLQLCEYLARLLLPPKRDTPRRLVVPFSGSGSEMIGALTAGWDQVVGIELSPEYCDIAGTRTANSPRRSRRRRRNHHQHNKETVLSAKCEMCRFWDKGASDGFCRRHAPRVVCGQLAGWDSENRRNEAVFPSTYSDEWCGDFEHDGSKFTPVPNPFRAGACPKPELTNGPTT